MYVYVSHMYVSDVHKAQKRALDALELEFQVVGSHHVGARNQTQVLGKNKCSEPSRHVSKAPKDCLLFLFTQMCMVFPSETRGHQIPRMAFQVVVSYHVGPGNRTLVLCRSSKCSQPLLQPLPPMMHFIHLPVFVSCVCLCMHHGVSMETGGQLARATSRLT